MEDQSFEPQNNGIGTPPPYLYEQPYMQEATRKKEGIGLAVASMVLGIISLVLFCIFLNVILAVLAVVFALVHLISGKKRGRGMAVTGIVTSVASIVLLVLFCNSMIRMISSSGWSIKDIQDGTFYEDMLEELYGDDWQDVIGDVFGQGTLNDLPMEDNHVQ